MIRPRRLRGRSKQVRQERADHHDPEHRKNAHEGRDDEKVAQPVFHSHGASILRQTAKRSDTLVDLLAAAKPLVQVRSKVVNAKV